MLKREMAFAGSFYPNSSSDIKKMFKYFNHILNTNIKDNKLLSIKPKAIIVPHAGYVYSAFTANAAFRTLKNSTSKRVVVIGPSHKIYLNGASLSLHNIFDTPFGDIDIDIDFAKDIIDKFHLSFEKEAHKEHSTEVQMPFIKYYLPKTKVVELIYGKISSDTLKKIINFSLYNQSLVVISSDLSHYYDINKANKLDSICLEAVSTLDTTLFHKGCEACGILGIEGVVKSAKENFLKPILLDYRTSADTNKDESAVVGYMSAAFV